MSTVLVTGGSGFIGSYCILQLLAAGHQVRTTVRSLAREGDVRAMLAAGGAAPGERLSFVAANLDGDKEAEAALGIVLKKLIDKQAKLDEAVRAAVTPIQHTIVIEPAAE